METLTQIVKRLSEEDYRMLLANITTDRFSKPYIVLETVRNESVTDAQMIEMLGISPSTYYTLKSRLNNKVAAILSKKTENPINALMYEVSRVPASLYGTDKLVAIRALKELEKQLLEYDLSNELIIVYHSLARLNMYNEEYGHYERLYNKFVAFSLASAKAENIYYDFINRAGEYELTKNPDDLEKLEGYLRELSNISELYRSHRLFVFFTIMRMYYILITATSVDSLVQKEMEMDKALQDMKAVFDRYTLDTFYNSVKFIIDALYFEYYQKIDNLVRARHYYKLVIDNIGEYAAHHIMNFHVIQFLNAKTGLFLATHDDKILNEKNEVIFRNLFIESSEIYNYICFHKYQAIVMFYEGDFSGTARVINNLRNTINLKQYWHVEIDFKLFQAFQYSILKEGILCMQLIGNIERSLRTKKAEFKNIRLFLKLMKTSFLPEDPQTKKQKIASLLESFHKRNTGDEMVLSYLQIDNKVIQKLARK